MSCSLNPLEIRSMKLLPWEYGIRNLLRRPTRSALTLLGLTTVVLLVLVVAGFLRGLERSLAVSGDLQTVIVFSLGMGENLEYSSVPMRTSDLVAASIDGIRSQFGNRFVSPELYQGTQVRQSEDGDASMGRDVRLPHENFGTHQGRESEQEQRACAGMRERAGETPPSHGRVGEQCQSHWRDARKSAPHTEADAPAPRAHEQNPVQMA